VNDLGQAELDETAATSRGWCRRRSPLAPPGGLNPAARHAGITSSKVSSAVAAARGRRIALQIGVDHGLALGRRWSLIWRQQAATLQHGGLSPRDGQVYQCRQPTLSITSSARGISSWPPSDGGHTTPCSSSRYAFLDRCAARDPDGRSPATGQRPWSAPSTITMDDPVVRALPGMGCALRPAHASPNTQDDHRLCWSSAWWSPPPESNRRPRPYQGTTRNRCASRRFPRSGLTVGVDVIGSLSAKVCAHSRQASWLATEASHPPNSGGSVARLVQIPGRATTLAGRLVAKSAALIGIGCLAAVLGDTGMQCGPSGLASAPPRLRLEATLSIDGPITA
jgi:hypothetical protein